MKMFSDCSGECCLCVYGTGTCLDEHGHGEYDYSPASDKEIIARLQNGNYPSHRKDMINELQRRGYSISITYSICKDGARPGNCNSKPTRLIPDEIVNVYTFEVTYVDKRGREYSEPEKRQQRDFMERLFAPSFPNADDVKCVSLQQFVTKAHEEAKPE